MSISPTLPTFLHLARELRDQIYDASLLAIIEQPPQSISADISEVRPHWRPGIEQPIMWKWRLPIPRGSCYGLIYSCRQIHSEVLERIESQSGLSFELELAVLGIPYLEDRTFMYAMCAQIWPMWIRFPLREPLVLPHWNNVTATRTCGDLHVMFKVQSEVNYLWETSVGLEEIVQNLFTMLARFLLYGPGGLHATPETSSIWNIDTLYVDITGAGTTFADPWDGQLRTVPVEVVENVELHLLYWFEVLCVSGALSDRVRIVILAVDGEIKRSWSIEEGKRLPPHCTQNWAQCGWIINGEDIPVVVSSMPERPVATNNNTSTLKQRKLPLKSCCNVQ